MNPIVNQIITLVVAIIGSSGVWSYLQSRREKKNCNTEMLLALSADRITYLGYGYIERGFITRSEYRNLHAMYDPYKRAGGNGEAKRMILEIERLPIKELRPTALKVHNGGKINDQPDQSRADTGC